jgi:SAM-dependent methyltransferase
MASERFCHRFLNDCSTACHQVAAERSVLTFPRARNVRATCHSAAAASPHMLTDNKKGDSTMLTTSRHALQKLSPAGVLIGFKILIFKANICGKRERSGAKIDCQPISANFPTFALFSSYTLMNRATTTTIFFLGVLMFSACRNETQQNTDSPALFREKPSSATNVSEQMSVSSSGEGNFESLIGDYENKDRGIWQKPNMVISLLGDLENKTVADIGAGTGYFTFRIVPKAKKVIGIDIDPRFISFLDSMKVRLPEIYKSRFEPRLAKANDPLLKPGEADAVVIVNTYGYIQNRVQYLRTLVKGISPGGRVLIIDFKKNNLPVGPADEFKVALSQVEKELLSAGFKIEKIDKDALDYQYIVIASAPEKMPPTGEK